MVYHPYCRLQTADSGLGKAVPEMVSRQAVKLYCELPLGHWRQAGSPPEDIWQWALYMTSWPWGGKNSSQDSQDKGHGHGQATAVKHASCEF